MVPSPDPGVYPETSWDEYVSWDAVSGSMLRILEDHTPAHLVLARNGEIEDVDSPARRMGRLIHTMVLEPHLLDRRWAIAPEEAGTNRARKAWRDWAKATREERGDDVELVGHEKAAVAAACRDALHQHSTAGRMLAAALVDPSGSHEVSVVWEYRGVRLKGRFDLIGHLDGYTAVADLKTTRDAGMAAYDRDIGKFWYHAKAAMYLDALAELAPIRGERRFLHLLVEPETAFVAVREMDTPTLEEGRRAYKCLAMVLRRCMDEGKWPAYADGVEPASLRKWDYRYSMPEQT